MSVTTQLGPPLFVVVLIIVVGGGVLGLIVRALMEWQTHRRSSLDASSTILVGIIGAGLGSLVVFVIMGRPEEPSIPFTAIASVPGTVVAYLVAARLRKKKPPLVTDLLLAGESDSVEFKETARRNLHTQKRDDRIEAAIAKTIAGYLNSKGGVLLIGVNDAGEAVGLGPDLDLMKKPDTDRYQLWLIDYLTRVLGPASLSTVTVSFPRVGSEEICRIDVLPSLRPVYATLAKSQSPVFYVRIGNSTRELSVDQAVNFCATRFRHRALRTPSGY